MEILGSDPQCCALGAPAAALLIFLVGTIIAIRRLAKVPTIRLVSTKQPPELALVDGLTWHLFLSHIWSVLWSEGEAA